MNNSIPISVSDSVIVKANFFFPDFLTPTLGKRSVRIQLFVFNFLLYSDVLLILQRVFMSQHILNYTLERNVTGRMILVMVCVDEKLERFITSFLELVNQMFGLIGKFRIYYHNSFFRQIKCNGATAFGKDTNVTTEHLYFPGIIEHGTKDFLLSDG